MTELEGLNLKPKSKRQFISRQAMFSYIYCDTKYRTRLQLMVKWLICSPDLSDSKELKNMAYTIIQSHFSIKARVAPVIEG
jgi:hypothetical protein